jgi:hypothetical protein
MAEPPAKRLSCQSTHFERYRTVRPAPLASNFAVAAPIIRNGSVGSNIATASNALEAPYSPVWTTYWEMHRP